MILFKLFTRKWVSLCLLLLFCQVGRGEQGQCLGFNVENAAWSFNNTQYNRMLESAVLKDNKNLSRSEKIDRIIENIDSTHKKNNIDETIIETEDLAKIIERVADCTGNDFAILSGLLSVESKYCVQRRNRKSGASGCGQFTSWPIRVYKNQLRLPGREATGDIQIKESMEIILNQCFKSNKKRVEEFKSLFSNNISHVKTVLRSGEDIEMDLVATALYLKFFYALSGHYYSTKNRSAGALSRYGEGSSYARKVFNTSTKVNACVENDDYLEAIKETSCQLSEDSSACYLNEVTYEI